MWPYDYFNQYSSLKNEFDIDENGQKKRKVFVIKWYGEEKREKNIEKAISQASDALFLTKEHDK